MEQYIEIPKIQTIMSFVATCIEATAREMQVSYQEVFHRMRRVGMIEHYIYPNYETLHTESREQLTQELIECLHRDIQLIAQHCNPVMGRFSHISLLF